MYKYKIYNNFSTRPLTIIDEDSEKVVGYVQKDYSNIFTRIIDFVGEGKFFNNFKVYTKNKNLVFKSNQISPFKYKHFNIEFMTHKTKKFTFELTNENKLNSFEEANFYLMNKQYKLDNSSNDWAYIINEERQNIAKCKSDITIPVTVYFELLDEKMKEYELLFIGIFHSYLFSG
ncbi:hypothetical protein BUY43_08585 [Staphylococcus devriesei]|uniref:Tubby C-terminal domain-containing protein n=3 Tax=Staphylococcus devriesei TaxID=586733 RepID=A0A2T4KRZ2_9STAP|nr:hypothetical protein [Staphylococcus devriesei]PTF05232.1 hypothetical protein BUY45_00795 [Staphylococcus devriesei]PTF10126.1 hypothetical protein BUY48_11350 [Staphylococcus devriesei]PTF13237.1 hypothetical protein BUY47_09990 [Staphylococcus devriesei]PTF16512.1 hypothetical protein BUY42_12055 [Staphylococcus devriesei]RIL72758.1 hypothetical protein BUY43_08585 [Staphylococcus devriesei]